MRFARAKKYAVLIIAAGSSARLGQAKQLLPYRNSFLLRYVLEECINAGVGEVYAVLGARRDEIAPKIEDLPVNLLFNPDWEEGMSTSIAFGIRKLMPENYDGVFIVLGDQPFFKGALLQKIIEKHLEVKAPIIISKYQNGQGPPTFFEATFFEELAQLRGDAGAKPVVKKHFEKLAFVSFENGHIDIDKKEDLKWLE